MFVSLLKTKVNSDRHATDNKKMKCCRPLLRTKVNKTSFQGERKVQSGLQSGRMRDEVPGLHENSEESRAMKLMGGMERRRHVMDDKRGWGDRGSIYDHKRLSDVVEDTSTDSWRVNFSQDIANLSGQQGINQWKEEQKAAILQKENKSTGIRKKIFQRDDLPPWMDWNVPPKRIRLQHTMDMRADWLKKTPDFDLSREQTNILQKVFEGLEIAFTHNPLPLLNFKEKICVTHCECPNWDAKDAWLILWKLVIDDTPERVAEYKRALEGGVISVWGKILARQKITQYRQPIVLKFVHDDGTIPYKRGLVDLNIQLANRGLAPKTVAGSTDHLQQATSFNKSSTVEPVKQFLLETRKRFGQTTTQQRAVKNKVMANRMREYAQNSLSKEEEVILNN